MLLQEVAFLKPDLHLLHRLLPVARGIFADTFSDRYEPESFERFCDEMYRPGGTMSRDFNAPGVHWLVAATSGQPIGYAKLTPLRAPAIDPEPTALEMQQLYVVAMAWYRRC